jgi:2-oxo-4-hydroxy-4-carboxy-5-ureidoimidazoline decarboxylase
MISLTELNQLDQSAFTAALGHLFEHSPWVAEETWSRRPFRDAKHLHAALCATMQSAPRERTLALIRAHPDLAGRLAQQNELTDDSAKEQAAAGLDRMSAQEVSQFGELNTAYRERFGFPFIICARLNERNAILRAMEQRIARAPADEYVAALAEIEKIAWLRLNDLLKQ